MAKEETQNRTEKQQQEQEEDDPLKKFESLVAKYGKTQNLDMFKHFHSPGFNRKHPPDINTIRYVLDGNRVMVSCVCGASLELTDYNKLEKV